MSELKVYRDLEDYVDYDECLPEAYNKSEADKVIAEKDKEIEKLKSDISDLRDDKKLTDSILVERNTEIAELKADYDEVRGRLQTANLIKDEQLAATCHNKYKRCLAMAKWCESEENRFEAIAPIFDTDKECWEYCSDYWYKWSARWLKIAEQFKEAK